MEISYLIDGREYLDAYLIRERLGIKKFELQHILNTYHFPESQVVSFQNKKLFSLEAMTDFIEMILEKNERQINGTEK